MTNVRRKRPERLHKNVRRYSPNIRTFVIYRILESTTHAFGMYVRSYTECSIRTLNVHENPNSTRTFDS
jgi:hypothetical protein